MLSRLSDTPWSETGASTVIARSCASIGAGVKMPHRAWRFQDKKDVPNSPLYYSSLPLSNSIYLKDGQTGHFLHTLQVPESGCSSVPNISMPSQMYASFMPNARYCLKIFLLIDRASISDAQSRFDSSC